MVRAIGRPTLRPAPLPDWIARAAARAACRSDQQEKTAGWRQRRAQLSERPQTLVLQMPPPGSRLSRRHRPGCKERTGADSMNALLVCVWTANHPAAALAVCRGRVAGRTSVDWRCTPLAGDLRPFPHRYPTGNGRRVPGRAIRRLRCSTWSAARPGCVGPHLLPLGGLVPPPPELCDTALDALLEVVAHSDEKKYLRGGARAGRVGAPSHFVFRGRHRTSYHTKSGDIAMDASGARNRPGGLPSNT